jgi:hypothetical protein
MMAKVTRRAALLLGPTLLLGTTIPAIADTDGLQGPFGLTFGDRADEVKNRAFNLCQ